MTTRVVVPQGDLGGIGPEVALMLFARQDVRAKCRPLLIGNIDALREIVTSLPAEAAGLELQAVADSEAGFAVAPDAPLPVLELENDAPTDAPGQPAASFGRTAVEAILRGGSMCMAGDAELLLTPPVHKESMHLAGYPYEGQTQILGELCRSRRYGMLACAGKLRVLIATRHMALRDALEKLDVGMVAKQLRIAHEAARDLLGLESPKVVLAALNPHAGEGGAFGDEEMRILRPAIERAREEHGFETAGPAVPDVVFAQGARGEWDLVVALYHDQAFIPLKMLPRDQAYTLFVGGSILRTSPVHGAAYDIARTGSADAAPLGYALDRGLELAARRAIVTE